MLVNLKYLTKGLVQRRNFGSLTNKPNYPKTFDKILIANRGEISRRVIRTCKDMGIKTVAVYSDADMNSMFVKEADEAYRIGPPPSSQSYLKMETILDVVKATGAQAVHPGYGFLSENSKFQHLLQVNGVKFIGPPTRAIEAMGDKIESKKLAKNAGVSTVPGFLGEVEKDEDILKISNEIGYPVMIKASAGGGGKGMRIAFNDKEALEGFKISRDEAVSSFGDGRIFIEKYIEEPRHIEYQILGDEFGNYVYLPERECSVQRRNQKVIEEAPSSAMDQETRHKMGTQALMLAKACGYFSTGTVEFLMDKKKDFYFLEMNTRLQVEHPITEEITGVDLVEQQILIASGHKLQFNQDDIKINGHSIEYRVYAEDPSRKFLPSIGFLKKYKEPNLTIPGKKVRIDTGVEEGSEISMYYDPMISKLITWGKDRNEAMAILDRAFDEYSIHGVTHNIAFGKSILANPKFQEGEYSTAFIPTFYPEGYTGCKLSQADYLQLASVVFKLKNIHLNYGYPQDQDKSIDSFYVSIEAIRDDKTNDYKVEKLDDSQIQITNLKTKKATKLKLEDFKFTYNSLITFKQNKKEQILQFSQVSSGGIRYTLLLKGNKVNLNVYTEDQYKYKQYMPEIAKIDFSKSIISPMPGQIKEVFVKAGDEVADGQKLCVIEAMKMQNLIKAEIQGKIKSVNIKPGQSVAVDELIIEFY